MTAEISYLLMEVVAILGIVVVIALLPPRR